MSNDVLVVKAIKERIINLPGRPPAILAQDAAEIYETETRQVNQAVKRNPVRFPEPDFCFRLTREELDALKSQNVMSSDVNHLPWAFTELGCNQLSAVLKSAVAAERSIQATRAFTLVAQAMRGDRAAANKLLGGLAANGALPSAAPAESRLLLQVAEGVAKTMEMMGRVMERFDERLDRLESARRQIARPAAPSHDSPGVLQARAFAADICLLSADAVCRKEVLYAHYLDWCGATAGAQPYDYNTFFRLLYLATPTRRSRRHGRQGGKDIFMVRGIKPKNWPPLQPTLPGAEHLTAGLGRNGEKWHGMEV
jgi:hypothetical protein